MSDSNYVRCPSYQLDPHKTVFIGALHGMLSAEALANIINDLFGGVVYAGACTDSGTGVAYCFERLIKQHSYYLLLFFLISCSHVSESNILYPYESYTLVSVCGVFDASDKKVNNCLSRLRNVHARV